MENSVVQKMSTQEEPANHKLYDKWTLWAHLPHDTDWTVNSYKNIFTFNSVEEIIETGRDYFKKTGRRVTFEYALMEGINDSPEIAIELARLLKGNGSHVNLIPINPTAGDFKRPADNRIDEFERILSDAGINCTVRVEKGTEISAACGQLRTDLIG